VPAKATVKLASSVSSTRSSLPTSRSRAGPLFREIFPPSVNPTEESITDSAPPPADEPSSSRPHFSRMARRVASALARHLVSRTTSPPSDSAPPAPSQGGEDDLLIGFPPPPEERKGSAAVGQSSRMAPVRILCCCFHVQGDNDMDIGGAVRSGRN